MTTPSDPSTTSSKPEQGKGLSTGVKVLLGCGALLFLAAVAASMALWLGGRAAVSMVESAVGSAEDREEASQTLERLETRHAFTIPEDGLLDPDRVDVFLAATDEAWEEMEPWASDLAELGASTREGMRARDMLDAARGLGGMMRARRTLAEVLDTHDMPLSEYVWTGMTLTRATESGPGVPEQNLTVARRVAGANPWLADGDTEGADPKVVLGVALLWGMADLSSWRALGLDTLTTR